MRLAIYGAGSLGTILGAYIAKSGIKIDLFNHNREHIKALKESGAHIIGAVNFEQKVAAYLPEEMSGNYDIIFLLTKQQNNLAVVSFLKNHLAEDGVIVTLQNGIPEIGIGKIVGEDKVLGCTVAWGATLISPGVVELTSGPDTFTFSLGSLTNNNHPKLDAVKRILELMGIVEIDENFIGSRWSKLLVNSAMSGMSATFGMTFGEVAQNKQTRKYVQTLIKEAIDVAFAASIKIEPIQGKDVVKLLNYKGMIKKKISFMLIPIAIKKHRHLKASMLQDLEKGKKCEIEAINGVICDYGDKYNVPTPCNKKIIEVIKKIENNEITYSIENLKYFKGL